MVKNKKKKLNKRGKTLITIIVLIIITCIYNLNDKFKINKNNFIIILFSYIIPIILFRILSVIINML